MQRADAPALAAFTTSPPEQHGLATKSVLGSALSPGARRSRSACQVQLIRESLTARRMKMYARNGMQASRLRGTSSLEQGALDRLDANTLHVTMDWITSDECCQHRWGMRRARWERWNDPSVASY